MASNNPTTLVLGATGATGRLLVAALLAKGQYVRVIVRSKERLSKDVQNHPHVAITEASVTNMSNDAIIDHVTGCTAVASCLGHRMTFRGMCCPPRRLVTDTTARVCAAIKQAKSKTPIRFILMNTAGNVDHHQQERVACCQSVVLCCLRYCIPPHADNEQAARYLRRHVDPSHWCVVRPDGLVDHDAVSAYDMLPSPTRSAIFDSGTTSRINVADVMARLIVDDNLWDEYKGRMPVVYNQEEEKEKTE